MSTFFRYVFILIVFILVAIGFSVYYPAWFSNRADNDTAVTPAVSEELVSQDYNGAIETMRAPQ
jgi:hypothetical protein